jgi:hypothetical protein
LNNDSSVPPVTSSLTVTGFGNTEQDGTISEVLRETQVFYLNPVLCTAAYPKRLVDNEIMMCANADGVDRYVTLD